MGEPGKGEQALGNGLMIALQTGATGASALTTASHVYIYTVLSFRAFFIGLHFSSGPATKIHAIDVF